MTAIAASELVNAGVVQVGDWGRDGTQNQSAVASLMATVADSVKPDFILSMGDNFYESKAVATCAATPVHVHAHCIRYCLLLLLTVTAHGHAHCCFCCC